MVTVGCILNILSRLKQMWNRDEKKSQKKVQSKSYGRIKKENQEILLDEAKTGYTRQVDGQNGLNRECYNLLQLNGVILSGMVIGIGFMLEFINTNFSESYELTRIYLFLSIGLIASSIVSVMGIMSYAQAKKKINGELFNNMNTSRSREKIIKSLIKEYVEAQKWINFRGECVNKFMTLPIACTMFSLLFFVLFIIGIIPPNQTL